MLALAPALKQGVSEIPGAKLKTSLVPELSGGVCVFAFENKNNAKIYEKLYESYGIAGALTGGVRLCPHIYNTMAEVEKAVAALETIVG